jgi:hypothetical protein
LNVFQRRGNHSYLTKRVKELETYKVKRIPDGLRCNNLTFSF